MRGENSQENAASRFREPFHALTCAGGCSRVQSNVRRAVRTKEPCAEVAALVEFVTRGSLTRTSRVTLPVAVLGGLYQWQRRRGKPEAKESLQQRDIVSEMEEVEVG
jgi:hypothetical protein